MATKRKATLTILVRFAFSSPAKKIITVSTPFIKSNQIKSNYFIVRLKVDQRAGQLSLPHLGITKTEKRGVSTFYGERIMAIIRVSAGFCSLRDGRNT